MDRETEFSSAFHAAW